MSELCTRFHHSCRDSSPESVLSTAASQGLFAIMTLATAIAMLPGFDLVPTPSLLEPKHILITKSRTETLLKYVEGGQRPAKTKVVSQTCLHPQV